MKYPVLILLFSIAAARVVAADSTGSRPNAALEWARPAPVRDLIVEPKLFGPFAGRVSADVESALAATPAPDGDTLARLLALRVHLALHLGANGRALAAATQIRERVTPPADRAFSGLLTEALVIARLVEPSGAGSPQYAPAFSAALASRLSTLPPTPELAAVLARQRDRFRELSRAALLAEAAQLAPRLDAASRWTLADVDQVVRIAHRLATILPLREILVSSFANADAGRAGTRP